jgi:hypothetical protein
MIDIKETIKAALQIPVIELFEPILPPCATWYPVLDRSGLEGDGRQTEEISDYQIDLWDRDRNRVRARARELKEALTLYDGVSIPELSYLYDTNGKMWRAMLTFSVIGKE